MNKLDVLKRSLLSAAVVAAGLASQAAGADVYITEWMYQGANGEFIELTNLGTTAVDFTSWSYDDDSRLPDAFSLSAFGIVNPGESVILTESSASDFIAAWNLGSSVKVIGGYTNNLGCNDEC